MTGDFKLSIVDCWRPLEKKKTAGKTETFWRQMRLQDTAEMNVDLKQSQVNCLRPLEKRETTGDCRDNQGLEIQ